MRISEKKVNRISKKILEMLQKDKSVRLLSDLNTIEAEIKSVIFEDLKEEDVIEEQAKLILDQHSNALAGENIDYMAILNRIKRQIAKEKGFVL
jgi:hypothetical protein